MENLRYESGSIREDIESKFSDICEEDLKEFAKLIEITGMVNSFLADLNNRNDSLEYYTRLINARIRDHMISATILIGKGYTVDGVTLVRSSLEDLWVVQNMYFKNGYLTYWKNGGEIYPSELRNLEQIKDRKEDNKNIYKELCNISHCNVRSIEHMARMHPSIKNGGGEGIMRVVKDFHLLLIAFYICYFQIVEVFEKKYENQNKVKEIKERLIELEIPFIFEKNLSK